MHREIAGRDLQRPVSQDDSIVESATAGEDDGQVDEGDVRGMARDVVESVAETVHGTDLVAHNVPVQSPRR